MSFRTMVGITLFVGIAIASMFILVTAWFLRFEISALVPAALALEIDQPLRTLLIAQTVALIVLGIVITVIVFFTIGSFIAKPLRVLSRAMDAFSKDGTREDLPNIAEAPEELRSLAASFTSLIDRVEESHKHDVNISRIKSDFISTAAHQLRTPLTGIRWALEALEKEPLNENQKALVASAAGKSHDLVGIVGTLLDISAIESGKYKYSFQPTDMATLSETLVKDFSQTAVQRKVSLFFSPSAGAVPPARADSERIKWVLNNLIDNAIDYTPEGGTVRVSVDAGERRIFVRVKDTGIGILPEDRGNIFERFYRSQNAITKKNEGNGLGLYIARTIATDHGGELNFAQNEEGPGTTFTLSLPVA
ncbi:MAG: HAMP domain-containing sensor histidine kinase [Minisyncoccia bacterium]